MPTKIVIAGEGGQGIQSIAKIITKAALKSGKNATFLPSFGVEQRGGVSLAFIQISSKPIPYPRFSKADILVTFCDRAIDVIKEYIAENTLLIYDSSAICNKKLEKIKNSVKNYLAVPAKVLATQKFTSRVANMIILGSMMAHLKEINFGEFENALMEEFGAKFLENPELKELNLNALKEGLDLAEKFDREKQLFEGVNPLDIQTTFSKEGISWSRFPQYCKGCGLCLVRCPVNALSFSKESGFLGNPLPEIEIEKCIGCEKCMKICPDGAIKVEKN